MMVHVKKITDNGYSHIVETDKGVVSFPMANVESLANARKIKVFEALMEMIKGHFNEPVDPAPSAAPVPVQVPIAKPRLRVRERPSPPVPIPQSTPPPKPAPVVSAPLPVIAPDVLPAPKPKYEDMKYSEIWDLARKAHYKGKSKKKEDIITWLNKH